MHVANAEDTRRLRVPDFVKVAWAVRVSPRSGQFSHVELELRVDATDDAAWRKFRRYFRLIGPASRFIRRALSGRSRASSADRPSVGTPGHSPETSVCPTPPAS